MSFVLFSQNLLEGATVTVTSAATNQPATRLFDRGRSLQWKATTNATQDIDIDLGSSQSYSFLGMVNHDLSTNLEIYRGTSFPPTTLISTVATPSADPVIASLGTTFTDRYVRVRILSGGLVPAIGELFLGNPHQLTLPPFLRSEGRGTMGNVRRDLSPAGYTWATRRGAKRSRFSFAWTGMGAADLALVEATYDDIDQGAKALFILDETSTAYWVNCVTAALAPVPVGAGLYELPELAFEEALT